MDLSGLLGHPVTVAGPMPGPLSDTLGSTSDIRVNYFVQFNIEASADA